MCSVTVHVADACGSYGDTANVADGLNRTASNLRLNLDTRHCGATLDRRDRRWATT